MKQPAKQLATKLTLGGGFDGANCSSKGGMKLTFFFAQEYLNANDVITFCLDLMSKRRRNLIKIRSCAIFSWLRVSSHFKVDKRLRFRLVSKEIRNVFIG